MHPNAQSVATMFAHSDATQPPTHPAPWRMHIHGHRTVLNMLMLEQARGKYCSVSAQPPDILLRQCTRATYTAQSVHNRQKYCSIGAQPPDAHAPSRANASSTHHSQTQSDCLSLLVSPAPPRVTHAHPQTQGCTRPAAVLCCLLLVLHTAISPAVQWQAAAALQQLAAV